VSLSRARGKHRNVAASGAAGRLAQAGGQACFAQRCADAVAAAFAVTANPATSVWLYRPGVAEACGQVDNGGDVPAARARPNAACVFFTKGPRHGARSTMQLATIKLVLWTYSGRRHRRRVKHARSDIFVHIDGKQSGCATGYSSSCFDSSPTKRSTGSFSYRRFMSRLICRRHHFFVPRTFF
jgi:hypothetical protein